MNTLKRESNFFLPIFLALFIGCSEKGTPTSGNPGKKSQTTPPVETIKPEQHLEKFHVVETREGTRVWELDAEEAEIYGEDKWTIVHKPKVKFYEKGKPCSVLTSRLGRIDNRTSDMSAEGNVAVFSLTTNTKIFTEKLRWEAQTQLILSDEFVREEKEDKIITGIGLEANSDLSRVVIKKDVKVKIRK